MSDYPTGDGTSAMHPHGLDPIEDEAAKQDPVYIVHVLGPDDVLVQPDRATAYRTAHAINTATIARTDDELNSQYAPTVWAVVRALTPAERLIYGVVAEVRTPPGMSSPGAGGQTSSGSGSGPTGVTP